MIVFKKLTYKNFLSTGNAENTILLNKSHSTLVIGKNGEGKSTMLDALCFVLFSKPFRAVTKPQLINSINGKNLLVECEFTIGTKEYKIIRGMKPNVFEIWCDGVMLNQDAAAKDYQKVLEQQILRLNFKTFTQVVILGSASFVPFMQLPAHQRREVIEDILDIRIFSVMNQLLKDRIQATKEEIVRVEDAVSLAKEKVNAQKRLIETLNTAQENAIGKLESKIRETLLEVKVATDKQIVLQSEVTSLIEATSSEHDLKADVRKATSAKSKIDAKHSQLHEHIEFFEDNSICPSCSQDIPHTHKEKTIDGLQENLSIYEAEKAVLESALEKLNEKLDKITDINRQLTQKNIDLSTVTNTISMLNRQVLQLNTDIQEHKEDTVNVDEKKAELKQLAESAMSMIEMKTSLSEQKNLQDIANLLLKDTGIKTAIIREYLPVMNKLINKYLNIMDSYIHFELDESFNEVIKSRFRDEFTYASFSEGEKQRIDLAILFTWRQIAKMKNSVNTNLLIFDEIMDSSLDNSGTESFMSLLNQFGDDTNIFVISHKGDILFDKFHSVIRVEKKNDFSTIV
jgi:DNA repair exonuclease SbcCD ATPase subunit